jgi:hypothetical protein
MIEFTMGILCGAISFSFLILLLLWMDKKETKKFNEWVKQYEMKNQLGINKTKVDIGGDSAYCFITNEFIGADVIDAGDARFSSEFDAWISKNGQELLADMNRRGILNYKGKIILREWVDINKEEGELQ